MADLSDLQQEQRGRRLIREFEQSNAEMKALLEKFSYSPELTAKFNATWDKIKQPQAETLAIRQKRLAGTRKEGTNKQNNPTKVKTKEVPSAIGTGLLSRLKDWIWGKDKKEPPKQQQQLLLPKK